MKTTATLLALVLLASCAKEPTTYKYSVICTDCVAWYSPGHGDAIRVELRSTDYLPGTDSVKAFTVWNMDATMRDKPSLRVLNKNGTTTARITKDGVLVSSATVFGEMEEQTIH